LFRRRLRLAQIQGTSLAFFTLSERSQYKWNRQYQRKDAKARRRKDF